MITRANVEATKAFIRERLGNPYVYGGALSTNKKQGTDCSEVWQTTLEMVHGRWKQGRQSEGATTESYRRKRQGGSLPDGVVGPFGTIDVNHWSEIPPNATARIAFHHGPGGGANSHMWGELDGMRIESGGSKGLVTGNQALAVENTYATAWAYLPGPIGDGPSVLAQGSIGPEVSALQERLNRFGAGLDVDGEFGPMTRASLEAFQASKGIPATGVVDAATRRALDGAAPPVALTRAEAYAQRIIAVCKRLGISRRGTIITLSVALVESNITVYANSGDPASLALPHDKVGSDHDSSGIYQQRPSWGSIQDRMNVERSTEIFLTVDKGPGVRGLTKIRDASGRLYDYNDTSRSPGTYAQKVQGSAYPDRYDERYAEAERLYNKLTALPTEELDEWEALMADTTLYASQSPYRDDDVPFMTPLQILRNLDTMLHTLVTHDGAENGNVRDLERVARLAAVKGPGAKSAADVERAQAVVRGIRARIEEGKTK